MQRSHFNFRHILTIFAIAFFLLSASLFFAPKTFAVTGINRTINFQGKLVNNTGGVNVANTSYTIVFTLYNNPNVGQGTALWTETQTVTTVDGIFRVALGSVTPIPSNFNFNWDGLYLGINVNSDGEMTPRIQMAAVPFAFNAQQVAGLTVQDENGNASTSGTLQVANGVTVKLPGSGTGLIYADTGATGTLASLTNSTSQTGSVIGLALTLSGANGSLAQTGLQFNLSGATSGTSLDIQGTSNSWAISRAGAFSVGGLYGNSGDCLKSGGGATSAMSFSACGGVGSSPFTQGSGTLNGVIIQNNLTDDTLFGGTSTASATFHIYGANALAGTQAVASIGAQTSFAALVVDNKGVGDIFTASYSGSPRFTITQSGYINLGFPGTANGGITLYSGGAGVAAATINTDLSGNLILAANNTSSVVQVGSGLGNIALSVSRSQDVLVADKTLTLAGAYTGTNDFTFKRNLTGGANNQSGAVLYITDVSGGSGTINPDLIFGDSELTSGTFTGNLLRLRSAGIDKFTIASLGTLPVATIAANTSFAAMIIDNANTYGDLFTASTSGLTRFVIKNNGSVGINVVTPTAMLDVAGAASFAGQLTFKSTFGSIQTTADQQLTLGGSTTGRILLSAFGGQTVANLATGGIAFDGYNTCTLKTDSSGNMICGNDNTSAGGGVNYWNLPNGNGATNGGYITPGNSTADLLLGGQSTASALFAFTGLSSLAHQTQASFSGNLIVMANKGYGGQIGIGTGSPNAQLSIQGATDSAVLGTNLTANPTFAGNDTGWTKGTGWSYSTNHEVKAAGTGSDLSQTIAGVVSGNLYEVLFTVAGNSNLGCITPYIAGIAGDNICISDDTAEAAVIQPGTSGSVTFKLTADASFNGTIDDVYVYPITTMNPLATLLNANGSTGLEFRPGGMWGSTNLNNVFIGTDAGQSNVNGSSNVFLGALAGFSNVSGVDNTFLGVQAGYSNTVGSRNFFFGHAAGFANTSGSFNQFIGNSAGFNNVTGSDNIFFGYQSGYNNSTGHDNTFLGYQTGQANTTGVTNVFIGAASGNGNTSGYSNTFVGNTAGYANTTAQFNSFFGSLTGSNTTDGSNNSAFGKGSLLNNTHGADNVALGYLAGDTITTGTSNTLLGDQADVGSNSITNAGAIGANAYVTQNNSLILGSINGINSATASTLVGIGTTAPLVTLDVRGSSAATSIASISGSTKVAGLVVDNAGVAGVGDLFTASASGATRFRIAQNGSILMQGNIISSIGVGGSNTASSAVTNAVGDQGSLIPNAGFESNFLGGIADGWFVAASQAATVTRDTAAQAKGTASIKFTFGGANSEAIYSACIPLAGTNVVGQYTLNWYVKPGATNAPATVRGYLDLYSSQKNCQIDSGVNNSSAVGAALTTTNTNWRVGGSGTTAIGGNTAGTWGKVHIFVACAKACTLNMDGVRLIEQSAGQGLDYAENYPADPNNLAQPGDVVSLATANGSAQVIPASKPMDESVIGVVSTNPGEVIGIVPEPRVPVALAGHVPVKVSTENGAIHMGDYLTSSDIPGVAAKAVSPGQVIGVAMEDYTNPDPQQINQIEVFVKNTYYNGGSLASNTGLTTANGKDIILPLASSGSFMLKSAKGPVVVFDTNGNATFSGTLFADKIKANSIEGLDIITNKVDTLSQKVDSLESLVSTSVLGASTPAASLEPATSSSSLTLQSLNVDGLATISADLNVGGNGFIQGALNVLDNITTNNLLVSQFAYFINDVVFKGNVRFNSTPTFSSDTAGFAVIKQGQDSVQINFGQEYVNTPVVTASIALNKVGDSAMQKTLEDQILNGNISYVITQRTTKGFIIKLNKAAPEDISLSWVALSVQGANISGENLTPTPAATQSAAFQSIINELNKGGGN